MPQTLHPRVGRDSCPPGAVHLPHHKWSGGLVNQDYGHLLSSQGAHHTLELHAEGEVHHSWARVRERCACLLPCIRGWFKNNYLAEM